MAETLIHGEMRVVEEQPEMWVKLDEVLDWLQELPTLTGNRVAGAVALEIRQMLIDSVGQAELVPGDG